MEKIYKYRPLSSFLFKELLYQELYFASYTELNDPLDLSLLLEFTITDKEDVSYLIWFLFKTSLDIDNESEKLVQINLINFYNDDVLFHQLKEEIYKNVQNLQEPIYVHKIIDIVQKAIKKTRINVVFNLSSFTKELERLTSKFFQNSYVTCFSETNDNYLMWSHYSSSHSGICLEFSSEYRGDFAYESKELRNPNAKKYAERASEWDMKSIIYKDQIWKVAYSNEQSYVNFFKFRAVFENEFNCDLIGLSKSWTHEYARELQRLLCVKTKAWEYEKEWRSVRINFDRKLESEERIDYYPVEALTGIYFGVNTPESVKIRILRIMNRKNSKVNFYNSVLENNGDMYFIDWDYKDE
ncbi:DUF2971 domain-containing protein [Myroides sp. 1354]|uniref:DUF2971 domain-containing protein n=1 Tax=unclassified Myroides TaxID=2642485 RepID=UPI0025789EF5|nr:MULTISPECIES: DUF2971 domain-containing protein [unclassified Myroides]MDM1045277.1 DUF2971 domain-containing protein [Myroides sp. R163-1]MDM1056159.1 DUF2971 domain-containing protein [Myroides sp. 1354]MDM1069288.1 DUF2971 domain-containing protein [Myroides sp. 1372]